MVFFRLSLIWEAWGFCIIRICFHWLMEVFLIIFGKVAFFWVSFFFFLNNSMAYGMFVLFSQEVFCFHGGLAFRS